MKSVQSILSTVAVLATIAALSLISVYSAAQDKKARVPSRKELVTLLKSCGGGARAHKNRCVLSARSSKFDAECQGAFGVGCDLPTEVILSPQLEYREPCKETSHCEKFAQLAKEQVLSLLPRRHGQRNGESSSETKLMFHFVGIPLKVSRLAKLIQGRGRPRGSGKSSSAGGKKNSDFINLPVPGRRPRWDHILKNVISLATAL